MADSAKPLLIAGACGGIALLGFAWYFAASSGAAAERDAVIRSEALTAKYGNAALLAPAAAPEPEEAADKPEAETAEVEQPKPEETETAAAETEEPKPEETETAAAETEQPKPEETETEEPKPAETETAEEKPANEASSGEATQTASVGGDVEAGLKVFKKCKACHMVGDGAKNRVGPVLTGIVGHKKGAMPDFKYSKVFQEASAAGEMWTPEALDAYLKDPRGEMKGTKMAFAGLRKDDDRANVIAYLASFE